MARAGQVKDVRHGLYHRPWNLLIYALAVGCLLIDLKWSVMSPVYVIGVLFLIWDVGYFFSPEAFTGRDAKGALDIITAGRQYMSWYMAFFGIFFGLLLTGDAEKLKSFLQLAAKAHVSLVVLLSPFLLVALSGLFIPIQIKATAQTRMRLLRL